MDSPVVGGSGLEALPLPSPAFRPGNETSDAEPGLQTGGAARERRGCVPSGAANSGIALPIASGVPTRTTVS
jgi:hypothetical protein